MTKGSEMTIIQGYEDICKKIIAQEKSFKAYLEQFVLDKDCKETLDFLAKYTDVYIFSGLIRNFLIGEALICRDIDIVLGPINDRRQIPFDFLRTSEYRKNSFGGFKIIHGSKEIDAWLLENTWGIVNQNVEPTPMSLINSAFFNFSAITFDYKKERFIFGKPFVKFLKNREIDIVYEENPNIPMCIINTLYYSMKYDLQIADNLKHWIIKNYNSQVDYEQVHVTHFNQVVFSNSLIELIIKKINDNV